MGLKTSCDRCGQTVLGITQSLKPVNGKYLCQECISNPEGKAKYYCNACHSFSAIGLKKGNGWIELVLYFFWIAPGIIYSIWRRSGPPPVCPVCRSHALVPASVAKPNTSAGADAREEVECPFCAEKILAKARLCKHCGKEVRV